MDGFMRLLAAWVKGGLEPDPVLLPGAGSAISSYSIVRMELCREENSLRADWCSLWDITSSGTRFSVNP